MNYWPHQNTIHDKCRRAYKPGLRLTVAAPCGAGKSLMMRRISIPAAEKGIRSAFYLHRQMLTRQTIKSFEDEGIDFGVIASGFKRYENPKAPIQICAMQTVASRMKNPRFEFPHADIVHVDEKHQQAHEQAETVFRRHQEYGAVEYAWTATPVGLKGKTDHLISDANYSDMLKCGAHLPVRHYGPDSPDLSKLKPMKGGDFSSEDDKRINRVPTIIARVYEYWSKLNPNRLPAIGFAPGVDESKWFVDEFRRRGVACAHIDSERSIFVRPNANDVLETYEYPTDDSTREELIEGSREGRYAIVWNRFILREAIDMPWLYHGIAATSMGALSTYLQAGGRSQRFWPEYDHVIWQDHSGNLNRHGFLDEDREWALGDTNNTKQRERKEQIQKTKGDEAEPICCPKCSAFRTHGPECHNCGYMHKRSVRMVRELDGTLSRQVGRTIKYKRPKQFEDIYRSSLYAAVNYGGTVGQAYGRACAIAKDKGVEVSETANVKTYRRDDPEWKLKVREVYPWVRSKR